MKKINLRDLYPDMYKTDHFVEVTEDVLETIRAAERAEAAYDRRMYRYKAYYSLDCDNGIENAILLKPQTLEMLLEEKQLRELGVDEDVIVADGLFCREIDGLFCRSSPDIIVRRRCVLSHKRRGWLQPSPSFRYSRNLALQDELYHPVINNGPAVLVCVDKRLGTGPVNQSRDAG